jgi:hypothetical protein
MASCQKYERSVILRQAGQRRSSKTSPAFHAIPCSSSDETCEYSLTIFMVTEFLQWPHFWPWTNRPSSGRAIGNLRLPPIAGHPHRARWEDIPVIEAGPRGLSLAIGRGAPRWRRWEAEGAAKAANAALLVLARGTNEVRAWVGSAEYFEERHTGSIDYTQVPHSPGSALEPLICAYALALERRVITPATAVEDIERSPAGSATPTTRFSRRWCRGWPSPAPPTCPSRAWPTGGSRRNSRHCARGVGEAS